MRTIIAGGRGITDILEVYRAVVSSGFHITTVISGAAAGVDRLGESFARAHNIPVHLYPANWDAHGRRAGFLRNSEMAKNADALIAVWDGKSPGTKHMIDEATRYGLKVFVRTAGSIPTPPPNLEE